LEGMDSCGLEPWTIGEEVLSKRGKGGTYNVGMGPEKNISSSMSKTYHVSIRWATSIFSWFPRLVPQLSLGAPA
jgi:hypothetical protein